MIKKQLLALSIASLFPICSFAASNTNVETLTNSIANSDKSATTKYAPESISKTSYGRERLAVNKFSIHHRHKEKRHRRVKAGIKASKKADPGSGDFLEHRL